MHDYLRAVGFSNLADRKSLQKILELVMARPEQEYDTGGQAQPVYWEKSKDFLPGAGLTLRGDFDENGRQIYEYFFPHYHGSHITFTGDVELEKTIAREEYKGVSELPDIGVVIIYHMNRMRDYSSKAGKTGYLEKVPVRLSALSIQGKVLIPLLRAKDDGEVRERMTVAQARYEAARCEDPEEATRLALMEMEVYHMLLHRLEKREDVLSIVESTFIPFGTDSDRYSILGDILLCKEQINQLSGERLWQMTILCNSRLIDLCINAQDLEGQPKVGRRFRGTIWLQGQL